MGGRGGLDLALNLVIGLFTPAWSLLNQLTKGYVCLCVGGFDMKLNYGFQLVRRNLITYRCVCVCMYVAGRFCLHLK